MRQIAAITNDARRLVEGVGGEAFNRQPSPGRWSAGQCLEHLNITYRAFLPLMREATQRLTASGRRARGPVRHGLFMRWFIRDMEPPPRRRYPTGSAFFPPTEVSPGQVLAEFLQLHDDLVRLLEQVNGYDLNAVKVHSPFSAWLRYRLGSGLALNLAHDRRHLWQARNAVDASHL